MAAPLRTRGGTGARAATGLRALALMLGVFFFFQAMGKARWLLDSSLLQEQLEGYLRTAPPISRWYLETFAMPGVPAFARIVMLGELATGLALLTGFWVPLAATLAFLMVLNFHVATGEIFSYAYLTSGFGLPVLGGLLALAVGGRNLPLSVDSRQ